MSVATTRYIRKPLYVDAVRLTGSNFDEIATWCQGEILQDEVPGKGTGKKYIHVRVHNPKNARQTKAFVGDWLLYTERGYKVYTNKAFHASFDEFVPEEESSDMFAPGISNDAALAWLREQHQAGKVEIVFGDSNGQPTGEGSATEKVA
jgi:ASC-1-like (ASCH) protein